MQTPLTWPRAVVAGTLTFFVLVGAFLYIPQWLLNGLASPARGIRVWMATVWIALALVASCLVAWRVTGSRRAAP